MTNSLKPYAGIRHSGVKWLGRVPAHRSCRRRVLNQSTHTSVANPTAAAPRGASTNDIGTKLDRVLSSATVPRSITVDHGTEFQSGALEDWAYRRGVQLDFIRPARRRGRWAVRPRWRGLGPRALRPATPLLRSGASAAVSRSSRAQPHAPGTRAGQSGAPTSVAYRCPIPGCAKVFYGSRGGWDAHIEWLRVHPNWHPGITDRTERKRLFRREYGDWLVGPSR